MICFHHLFAAILNSDGRDIVKKGHRKSKYLFAFPGLMAPVAGGKLGELTNLDSKNPVLYVEFPQVFNHVQTTCVYQGVYYFHFKQLSGLLTVSFLLCMLRGGSNCLGPLCILRISI